MTRLHLPILVRRAIEENAIILLKGVSAMSQITYGEVEKLAEQLSPAEQQALINHLQALAQQRALSRDEWWTLIDSITVNVPPGPAFSDRREDWYSEDGR